MTNICQRNKLDFCKNQSLPNVLARWRPIIENMWITQHEITRRRKRHCLSRR